MRKRNIAVLLLTVLLLALLASRGTLLHRFFWRTTRRTGRAGWPARARRTTATRSCCLRACMRATRGGAAA